MKVFSLRVSVASGSLPSAPAVFRLSLHNPVIKKIIALTSASASLEQMGYRITNQGINVFPFAGKGAAAGEDGFAPFIPVSAGSAEIEINESLFGPPYDVEVQCFNRTGAAINIDMLIFTDGKEKPQRVEMITPADNVSSQMAG